MANDYNDYNDYANGHLRDEEDAAVAGKGAEVGAARGKATTTKQGNAKTGPKRKRAPALQQDELEDIQIRRE